MKNAVVKGERIVIEEANSPSIEMSGYNDKTKHLPLQGALVKVLGCGLCGSDIVKYKEKLVKDGTVLGHEIVAEIVEINSSTDFKVGDKIVSSHHIPCFECHYCKNENYSMCEHFKKTNIIPGGFSEYVFLSEEHLQNVAVKIQANLSEVEASFYEPLGCCVRAIKRSGVNENSKALIVGLGSIGLLMGQGVKAFGADVYGCDIIQERIDKANELGIKAVNSNAVDEFAYDYIFMTAGADVTIDLALKAVRDGGKIVVFASTPKNFGYANNEIYYRELTVMGSYSPSPADLKYSMDLLASGKVKVKNISTIYDFSEIEKAFRDTMANTIMKAYIKISE